MSIKKRICSMIFFNNVILFNQKILNVIYQCLWKMITCTTIYATYKSAFFNFLNSIKNHF